MQVTFQIPTREAQELNDIAIAAGYDNAKALTIAYWKATLQASRVNAAMSTAREKAEAAAKLGLEAIA